MNTQTLIDKIHTGMSNRERDILTVQNNRVYLDYIHYNKLSYYLANKGVNIAHELWRGYKVYSVQTNSVIIEVTQGKQTKMWKAFISKQGKQVTLGRFEDFFEACCARKSAENLYYKGV